MQRHWTEEDEQELQDEEAKIFRSCVGSLIYLSSDVEVIAFAVKELARHLSKPTRKDYRDLTRVAKFLRDKGEHVVVKTVDRRFQELVVHVFVDADWGGSDEGKSTSGIRVGICGYHLQHVCQTQPGLPALSTGEAELRAIARGLTEGVYAQNVLLELGCQTKLEMFTNASASLQNSGKFGGGRIKHLRIADYFVKEVIRLKLARLLKVASSENPADLHTKHVQPSVLNMLWPKLGYRTLTTEELRRVRRTEVRKLNSLQDLEDSTTLVETYEANLRAQVTTNCRDLAMQCATSKGACQRNTV